MAWHPRAIRKPITARKGRVRMPNPVRVNLHVAVSNAASLHGYFNVSGRPDSHFYVRRDGTIEQYVDTAENAFADLQGNPDTISIETQGGVTNANGEKWTAAQVEALADIYAWAVRTHGIGLKVATDSRPGPSSHGLSWHRLGIDGNFPSGLLKGRVNGGLRYSNSRGKLCPGNAKIQQASDVLSRATAILGGDSPAPTTPTPAPAPQPSTPAQTGSIVDWLNSQGRASSFQARATLARQNGISNYTGTAAQNTRLLNILRGSSTPAPKPSPSPTPAPRPSGYTGNSIVDYLRSIGQPSSLAHRRTLARQYGISPYAGTASQNTRLLAALRGGSPAKPKQAAKSKTVSQMATEVLRGVHGNGHAQRRRSLGVNAATYDKVRKEVNRRA